MGSVSRAEWLGGLTFAVEQDGHRFVIDGPEEFGGRDLGPRPKNLLLTALIGCTGMDVVSILDKMRVSGFELRLTADGELTPEHPVHFSSINVEFRFRGNDLPREKLEKAVNLSRERYCGVSRMLGEAAELSYRVVVEEAPPEEPI